MRFTSILVAALAIGGCASDSDGNGGDGAPMPGAMPDGGDARSMDGGANTDGMGMDDGPGPMALPDFSLTDANDTSPTAGAEVSPRDFLGKVSGWYFTHAT